MKAGLNESRFLFCGLLFLARGYSIFLYFRTLS